MTRAVASRRPAWRGTTAFGCVFIAGMVVVVVAGTIGLALAVVEALARFAGPGVAVDASTLTLAFTGLGLAGAALGFFITKAMEFNKEREDRVATQKREAYAALLGPWLSGAPAAPSAVDEQEPSGNAPGRDGLVAALVYGSDDVLRAYGSFRAAVSGAAADPPEVVPRLVVLLRTIRADLGHDGKRLSDDDLRRTLGDVPLLPALGGAPPAAPASIEDRAARGSR